MKIDNKLFIQIFLVIVCFVAIWKSLQLIAISAMIGLFITIYKTHFVEFKALIFEAIKNTKQAKFKDFELQLAKDSISFGHVATEHPLWVRVLASRLEANHLGLLLTLQNHNFPYKFPQAHKRNLRELRDAGLLEHDASTLKESKEVWLTPLGKELAQSLVAKPVENT